ncbi:TBC1D2B [Acanthosepion pharaonis]|uniref:TBC1D2B n=1 Tax=Acanthosepion pharaonis TaxID=158019 RepID=A0A812DUQ5_ACAPH|nr:TBC1D2B [Sepia pharaonis]
MSGWHSLSGYLHFKPGGAFQKLKAKKRLWFIFEESRGQLLCYRNEADSQSATPIDSLDIKDAAIMLDLEQQNQFIIMCKGKDYIFRAENHESMMIWLLGLQAKQEIYSCVCCAENKSELYETAETYNREKLYQRGIIQCVTNKVKPSIKSISEVPNSVSESGQIRTTYGKKLLRVRSLPPLLEGEIEAPALVMKSNVYNTNSVETNSKIPSQTLGGKVRSNSFDQDEGDAYSDAGDEMPPAVGRGRSGKRNSVTGESIRIVTASINSRHSCLKKPIRETLHTSFKSEPSLRERDLEDELIESKCEMAKVLNTLTGYQEALSRKDLVILRLDQKLEELELNVHHNNAERKLKEFQEHVRILQNKNRFLNKEVKRLAVSRRQEQMKFTDQYEETKLLESEVESWKRDYVILVQSSLHFPNNECTEEPKFVFYGSNHHKEKVCELLEEARKINPGLPLFESLINQQVHVDSYGFKHMHTNEDMVVHYICQQLTLHYSMQLESYENRQLQFKYFCQDLNSTADETWKSKRQMKVLKVLCRKGIPDQFRKKIWCFLINKRVEDLMMEKGSHYFSNLINIQADCNSAAKYRRQIFVDLLRTMPNNVKFSTAGSKGIMDLRDVLLAYCVHNPTIGYCQGMNFFAAMCLLFLNTEDTFWALVAITECYFPEHYFDYNLIGAQADQALLKDVLKETLPKLSAHLENNDIELSTITLTWFMSIFFDSVPFQVSHFIYLSIYI